MGDERTQARWHQHPFSHSDGLARAIAAHTKGIDAPQVRVLDSVQ